MFLTLWPNWNELWELRHKVEFDGYNKLIIVHPGILEINFKEDIYSAWKQWSELYNNLGYEQALRAIGGDPLVGGQYAGTTYFLMNDWKIRTWESDTQYELVINGNLYSEDGYSPFVATVGPTYAVVRMMTSNLVDFVDVSSEIPTTTEIADAVWEAVGTEYITSGTMGEKQNRTQAMLLELYALMGLDPTKPLVVTQTTRKVPEDGSSINQTLTDYEGTITVQRI